MSEALTTEQRERLIAAVDETRLVATASSFVDIASPTGSEQEMAERMREVLEAMGLAVSWQEVEDGRPNVVGRLEGSGGAPSLMFNGHMDTSYSGREAHLRDKPGFQPHAEVRDGHIWGLGISNMKGALACYVEAVRAIADAGLRLRGDVVIAAVVGEIEKTQWGEEFRGAQYRGYAAGSRYLPTHGGIADCCILGEPTEQRIVLGHYGTMWARISTEGPFVHTAFSHGRLGRTRSCGCRACSPTCSHGSPAGSAAPPTAGSTAWSTSARSPPARRGGSAAPPTGPTSSSTSACRRRWR